MASNHGAYGTAENLSVASYAGEKEERTVAVSIVGANGSDSLVSEGRERTIRPASLGSRLLGSRLVRRVMAAGKLSHAKSATHNEDISERNRPWRTTWIRFGPLSGIFSMVLAVLSLIASLGILAGSDGQAVSNWSAPPSTYLAIFTAIANLSMRYAAIQGVVIAWWSRASRGSTLAKLHWNWRAGTTLRGALTSGRHMGLLGLACIVSTVVVVDGPLLQRSSTVKTAPIYTATSLDVSMAPEIPSGLSGAWATAAQVGLPGGRWSLIFNETIPTNNGPMPNNIWSTLNPVLLEVTGDWVGTHPLQNAVRGCPKHSVCHVKLKAPALWPTSCTTHQLPIDYRMPMHANKVFSEIYAAPLNHEIFFIDVSLNVSGAREAVNVITGFAISDSTSVSNCSSTLVYQICTLESAIGEYVRVHFFEFQSEGQKQADITVFPIRYNVTVHGQHVIVGEISTPALVRLADNTAVNYTWDPILLGYPSTLAGIVGASFSTWNTLVTYYTDRNNKTGSLLFGSYNYQEYVHQEYVHPGSQNCPWFKDPQRDVLQSMNQLMFYLGYFAAKQTSEAKSTSEAYLHSHMDTELAVNYTTTGHIEGHHSIFTTDCSYFAGAAVVEIICILLVLPTYWGWWKLGRPVSFSPLEIAKAFESAMLDNYNSNSSGRDLAKATSNISVRYGLMQSTQISKKTKIAFGDPNFVNAPQRGLGFDV